MFLLKKFFIKDKNLLNAYSYLFFILSLFITNVYLNTSVINIRLTISALIQNELYLIAKQMKKNAEDTTLIMTSIVHFEVMNVVNCK